MEKMKVVLDYNLNLESNESCLFDKFNIATNVPLVASVFAWKQCDQMVKIIFQYLAICNNENYPNNITKFAKVDSSYYQIRNEQSKICNFCQSGEISPYLVTLRGSNECTHRNASCLNANYC